jgi:hypothetical protein
MSPARLFHGQAFGDSQRKTASEREIVHRFAASPAL